MTLALRINLILTFLLTTLLCLAMWLSAQRVQSGLLEDIRHTTADSLSLVNNIAANTELSSDSKRDLILQLGAMTGTLALVVEGTGPGAPFRIRARRTAESLGRTPGWFARWVTPAAYQTLTQSLMEQKTGSILLQLDPNRSVKRIWQQLSLILYVLAGFLFLSIAAILLTVRHALRPVKTITEGLATISQGSFDTRLHLHGLPEFREIAFRINHLAESLANSRQREKQLKLQSISAQEDERRFIAQELHDEMGQSITAMKALIASNGSDNCNRSAMMSTCDQLQLCVRQLMQRLRPDILDRFGLKAALQQMVDDWNELDDSCFCALQIEGDLQSLKIEAALAIYRMVQECLTNTRKHAGASHVSVNVIHKDSTLELRYDDNGRGLNENSLESGYGLRGMRERVQVLDGTVTISNSASGGFLLICTIPASGKIDILANREMNLN